VFSSNEHLRCPCLAGASAPAARQDLRLPGDGAVTYALPECLHSPALAREITRERLIGLPDEAVDTVVMLVSEVTANAVMHARSMVTLQIEVNDPAVKVRVEDCSPDVPQPRSVEDDDEGGRGLWLVDALSSSWGWEKTPTGKQVWFEVS
jgi:anti-sigma regulatory factor (Ser/Thr protein kinase)